MSKTGRIYITKIIKYIKINNIFFNKNIYIELNNRMIDGMNLPSSIDGVKSLNTTPSNFRLILTLLDLPMTLASLQLKECSVDST